MLLAVAALLFQFPTFSLPKIHTAEERSEPASVARAVDDSTGSDRSGNSTLVAKEVLSAARLSSRAEASVAFAPGRLMAEPADPVARAAFEPAPIVRAYKVPLSVSEQRRQNREWLALSLAAHSAAGFDAWSTRLVISSMPQAREMNPLLRPFAGNASMYAAVQLAPTMLDFLSRRMMNSRHGWIRHTWWLPQAVSAAVSLGSGVHNLGVYNSR
jgi:hypothetical protein